MEQLYLFLFKQSNIICHSTVIAVDPYSSGKHVKEALKKKVWFLCSFPYRKDIFGYIWTEVLWVILWKGISHVGRKSIIHFVAWRVEHYPDSSNSSSEIKGKYGWMCVSCIFCYTMQANSPCSSAQQPPTCYKQSLKYIKNRQTCSFLLLIISYFCFISTIKC